MAFSLLPVSRYAFLGGCCHYIVKVDHKKIYALPDEEIEMFVKIFEHVSCKLDWQSISTRILELGLKLYLAAQKRCYSQMNSHNDWLKGHAKNFWKKLLTKWNSQTHMWENNRVIYSTWHTNLLLHETPGHEDIFYDQIR